MKTIPITIIVAVLIAQFAPASAAPFQNLDFEDAQISPDFQEISGPAADLLPGWTVTLGSLRLESVGFNFCSLDAVDCISLGRRDPPDLLGEYGLTILRHSNATLALTQFGGIPLDAYYLQYTYVGGPLRVTINGQTIGGLFPSHLVSQSPRTVQLDVSRFAGQSVELGFHTQEGVFGIDTPLYQLDSIGFVVPEPSTLALGLASGGLFAGAHLWRRRSKR